MKMRRRRRIHGGRFEQFEVWGPARDHDGRALGQE